MNTLIRFQLKIVRPSAHCVFVYSYNSKNFEASFFFHMFVCRIDQTRPMETIFKYLKYSYPGQSKHRQLVDGVNQAILQGEIRSGEPLPSVTTFMNELSFSRMTVMKALGELKDRGIIESKKRIGYFIKSENIQQQLKIMLFLTAFNPYQEALYNSLIDELEGHQISVDLFFHHGNPKVMRSILKENLSKYGLYLITPIDDREVIHLMDQIPDRKLLQIARPVCSNKEISYVSQDFYIEVIQALESITRFILKYQKFVLIYPPNCYHSIDIKNAFINYCNKNHITHSVESKPDINKLSAGTAFFTIEDGQLIKIIKDSEKQGFRIGKDIGILSYNDTPMKEMIRDGITVISTDFDLMGRKAAQFVITKSPVRQVIKTKILLRNSL